MGERVPVLGLGLGSAARDSVEHKVARSSATAGSLAASEHDSGCPRLRSASATQPAGAAPAPRPHRAWSRPTRVPLHDHRVGEDRRRREGDEDAGDRAAGGRALGARAGRRARRGTHAEAAQQLRCWPTRRETPTSVAAPSWRVPEVFSGRTGCFFLLNRACARSLGKVSQRPSRSAFGASPPMDFDCFDDPEDDAPAAAATLAPRATEHPHFRQSHWVWPAAAAAPADTSAPEPPCCTYQRHRAAKAPRTVRAPSAYRPRACRTHRVPCGAVTAGRRGCACRRAAGPRDAPG